MQLFRSEAIRGHDRLHGEVVLAPPVSWQILGGFLLLSVLLAAAFLASAQYSKVTSVGGRLTGDKGVIRAVPPRAGVVEAILVQEGQKVAAGTPLARISLATSNGDASLEELRSAAIAERGQILKGREPDIVGAARARIAALRSQISGDRAEAASIQAQREQQQALVRSAAEELEKALVVRQRGFISGQDILEREERLATRRQDLSRLDQELAGRTARIAGAQADLSRAQSELELQMADLAGARAELAGIAAADENMSVFIVTATEAGTVTGITVHPGDAVTPERPIMSIIPSNTQLRATLEVPPAAAGFLQQGQSVRIAVDAFPYQTYGTVDARIASVSLAAVPVVRADGTTDSVFLVEADLESEAVPAYGRSYPLRPGMTVSARVTTRRHNLMEALFDPIFAVARR